MDPTLDEFSQSTADRLFSLYPEWRGRETVEHPVKGIGSFRIEIPAPPEANVERGLWIMADGDEVIIGFDAYHDHFFDYAGNNDTKAVIDQGMNFLSELLSEKVAAVSWWKDEKCLGSNQVNAGEQPDSSLPHLKDANRIRVRSWKGALNSDIRL